MKINDLTDNIKQITINSIKPGDIFKYNNKIYLKLNPSNLVPGKSNLCVVLDTNDLTWFSEAYTPVEIFKNSELSLIK